MASADLNFSGDSERDLSGVSTMARSPAAASLRPESEETRTRQKTASGRRVSADEAAGPATGSGAGSSREKDGVGSRSRRPEHASSSSQQCSQVSRKRHSSDRDHEYVNTKDFRRLSDDVGGLKGVMSSYAETLTQIKDFLGRIDYNGGESDASDDGHFGAAEEADDVTRDAPTSVAGSDVFGVILPDPPSETATVDDNKTNDLLESFSAQFTEDVDTDDPVDDKLAGVIDTVLKVGVSDSKVAALMDKHKRPANVAHLQPVTVNQTIWDNLSPTDRSQDLKLQKLDKLIRRGMVPLLQLADNAVKEQAKAGTLQAQQVFATVTDSLALLGQAAHELSMRRRDFLKPSLKDAYKRLCSDKIPVTTTLFGEDLAQSIKDIGEATRMANVVQLTTPKYGRFSPSGRTTFTGRRMFPRRDSGNRGLAGHGRSRPFFSRGRDQYGKSARQTFPQRGRR